MSEFTFQGVSCQEKGITLLDYQAPAASEGRITQVEIPGRDGSLILSGPVYQDVTISLHCAVLGDSRQEILATLRQAAGWLQGQGELTLWDQPGLSRPGFVAGWSQANVNRQWAEFTVAFRGGPFLLGQPKSVALGSIQVEGTVPARGVVSVTLAQDTTSVRIASSHGQSMTLTGDFKAQQIVAVDMETGDIQLDGQAANHLMELGGKAFGMPPGAGTITCQVMGEEEYETVAGTFVYRPRWC